MKNQKIHIFFSGFCLGGSLLTFRNVLLTSNPEDIIILFLGIAGFLANLYCGIRNPRVVSYFAKTRLWLKNDTERNDNDLRRN